MSDAISEAIGFVDVRHLGTVVEGVYENGPGFERSPSGGKITRFGRDWLWELTGELVITHYDGGRREKEQGAFIRVNRATNPNFYQHPWIGNPLGGIVTELRGNDLVHNEAICRDGQTITWWGPGDAEHELIHRLGTGVYPGTKIWVAYWRGDPQKGGTAFVHYVQLPGGAIIRLPFRVFGEYGFYMYHGPSQHQYTETGARELCGEADLPPLGVDPTQFPDEVLNPDKTESEFSEGPIVTETIGVIPTVKTGLSGSPFTTPQTTAITPKTQTTQQTTTAAGTITTTGVANALKNVPVWAWAALAGFAIYKMRE